MCSEYINNTYPDDSEMIKVQTLQEMADDDSSKETIMTEDTNAAGSTGHKDANHQRRVRSKGRSNVKNREDHELSPLSRTRSLSIGVCGGPFWADPKTNMIECARKLAHRLLLCLNMCMCVCVCVCLNHHVLY